MPGYWPCSPRTGRKWRRSAAGRKGYVVLDRTPFYVEAGGQVSDVGELRDANGGFLARVEGVARLGTGLPRAHRVRVDAGAVHAGSRVIAAVTDAVRDATRRNHTATHLLHAALRQVLGPHVKQAGSLVAPDRLRFDFMHAGPVTPAQRREIERIVNAQIYRNAPVTTDVRSRDEAVAAGAMALFGEKYGDAVRVVTIPGFSMELCGGTHCRATGDIGLFTIVQEGGVAAGVRRIEALTGEGAVLHVQHERERFGRVLETLQVGEDQALDAIAKLQAEARRLARETQDLRMKLAVAGTTAPTAPAEAPTTIVGVEAVLRRVEGLDKAALRDLADSLKVDIEERRDRARLRDARRQGRHRGLDDGRSEGPRPCRPGGQGGRAHRGRRRRGASRLRGGGREGPVEDR